MGRLTGLEASLTAFFSCSGQRSVCRVEADAPLELRGPFRTAPGRDGYFLRNTTCGVLAGDRYRVRIVAEANARVQIAASSATKVLAMPGQSASLDVELTARPGSLLVWGPHATIIQREASFTQNTSIAVHRRAIVLAAEVVALGRLESGELCAFHRFASSLTVRQGEDQTPAFEESFCLRPGPTLDASLGGRGALASVYALGVEVAPALEGLRSGAEAWDGLAGFSALPNGAGVVARMLASSLSAGLRFCEDVIATCQYLSPSDLPGMTDCR